MDDDDDGTVMKESRETLAQLVLEYSEWVLREEPEDGLRIFTHSHGRGGGLDPFVVYQHLQRVADPETRQAYLESLIQHGETGEFFHNELVFTYYGAIRLQLDREVTAVDDDGSRSVDAGTGRLRVLRKKMLDFLGNSKHYRAKKMLLLFPEDELLEERAVLLQRTGQHAAALSIYAHRLKAPAMAEDYCKRHYNEATEGSNVYLQLLKVLLCKDLDPMPSPPPKSNLPAALRLLTEHHSKIDHALALDLLPVDIPTSSLTPFLSAVLSERKHLRRNNQVVLHLLKAENRQVLLEKMELERQRVVITPSSVCLRCGKRIGKAAFARRADGRLMHYVCEVLNLSEQQERDHHGHESHA